MGCTDESKKAANTTPDQFVNTANQDTFKLTLDDIKKKYTEVKILNINEFKEGYVLVESIRETVGNKFDLYDLKTGEMDTLPKGEFGIATLEQIINENYFVFLSNGKDSDGPFGKFPYLISASE